MTVKFMDKNFEGLYYRNDDGIISYVKITPYDIKNYKYKRYTYYQPYSSEDLDVTDSETFISSEIIEEEMETFKNVTNSETHNNRFNEIERQYIDVNNRISNIKIEFNKKIKKLFN